MFPAAVLITMTCRSAHVLSLFPFHCSYVFIHLGSEGFIGETKGNHTLPGQGYEVSLSLHPTVQYMIL